MGLGDYAISLNPKPRVLGLPKGSLESWSLRFKACPQSPNPPRKIPGSSSEALGCGLRVKRV